MNEDQTLVSLTYCLMTRVASLSVLKFNEIYQYNDRQESAHDAYIHLSVWVSLDAR